MTSRGDAILEMLRDRVDLVRVPFSDRGSRLMVLRSPDGSLELRLAERWFRVHGTLDGYRRRPALLDQWAFTDEAGQPLPCDVVTWPHRVDLRTARGTFSLAFLDTETLIVRLPPGAAGMTFRARTATGHADRRGGVLITEDRVRRRIAYTTNASVVANDIHTGDDCHIVRLTWNGTDSRTVTMNVTPRLALNRYIPDATLAIEAAAARWRAWFEAVPAVHGTYEETYYYAWWVMRSGLISSRFYTTREAMTPSKLHYVGVWQWDAFFHALAYRHVDMGLAKDQLRIVLDHQREDGMIPDAIHDEGVVAHLTLPVDADVTKPPLVAWTAWKLYETDGDREFLDEIYAGLVRWNDWWFTYNDADGNGLCEYRHPFSSGLDDSPLWDTGMPVEAADLNTYLCLQQEALGRIAAVLGLTDDARRWRGRADAMARRMQRLMWDEAAGEFASLLHGRRIAVNTPFGLLPLATGRLPANIVDRLVARLTDPRLFWTRYPVPSVAVSDPAYDPMQMWRGPTWLNVNYLLIEGLRRCGRLDVAGELRDRTLELIAGHRDIHEYYHPETGSPPPKAASVFGWSAALFIELVLQAQAASLEPVSPARG